MNYNELKQKQAQISALNLKIITLRVKAESITQQISDTPVSSNTISDKIGIICAQIADLNNQKTELETQYTAELNSIPNTFEGQCAYLKLYRRYSWTKLAMIAGGNNTADSIRKRVMRYDW